MAIQDYLTLSHLRKVVAAITQRIVGVENSVSNVENDVSDINGAIEELQNDKEVFIITMSYASVENYTLSATYEEIATAIRNGKTCCVTATLSGGSLYYIGEGSISEIFFENTDYLLAVNTNDTVTVVSRHIWIDNNSNKWVTTPFENFNLLSDVYCNLNASIYNPTIEDYDYSNIQILTERRKKYIYYIDPKTSDTVIFTNTDSSVNEWTRTVKPGSYSISRSSDTLTLTGSDGSTSTATLPSKTSDLVNDSGFLTSHQSLANYVTLNSSQTISGTKTFDFEVKFNAGGGASDICSGIQCAFKTNRSQISNFFTKDIYTKTDDITFHKYASVSGQAPSSLTTLFTIKNGGTVSIGTASDIPSITQNNELTTKKYVDDAVNGIGGGTLSISSNVITLTGSDGTTSSVTLPVYNGGVSS